MNIIILKDFKGFQKEVVVPIFPIDYRMVEHKSFSNYEKERDYTKDTTVGKLLVFYPEEEVTKFDGGIIRVYRQIK